MSSLDITLESGIDGELFAAQRALVLELSTSNLLKRNLQDWYSQIFYF